MTDEQAERLIVALERIAAAMGGVPMTFAPHTWAAPPQTIAHTFVPSRPQNT